MRLPLAGLSGPGMRCLQASSRHTATQVHNACGTGPIGYCTLKGTQNKDRLVLHMCEQCATPGVR